MYINPDTLPQAKDKARRLAERDKEPYYIACDENGFYAVSELTIAGFMGKRKLLTDWLSDEIILNGLVINE